MPDFSDTVRSCSSMTPRAPRIALGQGLGGNATIRALRAVLVGDVEENEFRPGARARFLGHEALQFRVRAILIARRGALGQKVI